MGGELSRDWDVLSQNGFLHRTREGFLHPVGRVSEFQLTDLTGKYTGKNREISILTYTCAMVSLDSP